MKTLRVWIVFLIFTFLCFTSNATAATQEFNGNVSGTASNLLGTPALPNGTTATTQAAGSNDTKLATDAYVDTGLALKAPLANPTFTGTVKGTGTADDYFFKEIAGGTLTANVFTIAMGSSSGAAIVEVTYGRYLAGAGNFGEASTYALTLVNGTLTVARINNYGADNITTSVTSQTATFILNGHASLLSRYNVNVRVIGISAGGSGDVAQIVYTRL